MKKVNVAKANVIFRTYTSGIGKGQVIALFPDIVCGYDKNYVMSYMHIGQHSDAEYAYVMRQTRPATEEEYAPLKKELEQIGYENLRIMKRRHFSHS